ncbi:hypothetical protein TNCV_4520201 [Trichonephila clavipes]|nr:hypothetical protein TNCV_4520201 [Trichonephila clavipes]
MKYSNALRRRTACANWYLLCTPLLWVIVLLSCEARLTAEAVFRFYSVPSHLQLNGSYDKRIILSFSALDNYHSSPINMGTSLDQNVIAYRKVALWFHFNTTDMTNGYEYYEFQIGVMITSTSNSLEKVYVGLDCCSKVI